jgi:hypothetical protein
MDERDLSDNWGEFSDDDEDEPLYLKYFSVAAVAAVAVAIIERYGFTVSS